MGFIVFFIILFLGFLFKRQTGTWTNPATIMCYLWAIVSVSASLRLFNLNDISFKTWLIILVGTLCFSVGCFLRISFGRKNYIYVAKEWADKEFFLTPKLYWLLFAIVAFFLVIDLKTSISLMKQGYRLDVIRQATMGAQDISGYVVKTSTLSVYLNYIRNALQAILIAVGIERFFADFRHNLKYVFAVVFLVAADAYSDGGRWIIVYASIEFLICYSLLKRKERINQENYISKKAKRFVLVIVIGLFVLMEKITTSRMDGGYAEHFYIYLCGCVPFLDLKIKELAASNIFTGVFSSQYGIWSLIMPYIKMIIGHNPALYTDALTITGNTQVYEYISDHQTYNAFITSFYSLFADLRWIGLAFGMLTFGVLCGSLFRKAYEDGEDGEWRTIAPYLVITQMMIKSIQTYPLASNIYVVTLILLWLLFRTQSYKSYANRY